MTFREILPQSCPPSAAISPPKMTVLRLVAEKIPTADDFDSYYKKDPQHYIQLEPSKACLFASCSCYKFDEKSSDVSYSKLPRNRRKFVAHMAIDQSTGLMQANHGTGHIDLWMFGTFDPVGAVTSVVRRP